jgi:uncharacterized protein involved in high-affinity Fe2+ transport
MNIRKLMVLLLLAVYGCFMFASCGQQQKSSAPPASTVEAADEAGFEEFPIGDDNELGPLNVAGVYFQPVEMLPVGNSLPAAEADMHIEADISALDNDLGYGVGDFVPNLTVRYEIAKSGSSWAIDGTFMPMNASDGPHYGANIKLNGAGTYNIKFLVQSPEAQGFLLHVDQETGVPGRFWQQPLVAEWDFDFIPRVW